MPKGPLKTPFEDYVVGKKGPGSSGGEGVYELDMPGGPPLIIGVKAKGVTGDLLEDMGK